VSYPIAAANRLIDQLGINDISDLLRLEEIAWARGVLVTDDNLEGSEASIVISYTQGVITVSTAIQDQKRRRFSIAHELGHFELHRGNQELLICQNQDIQEALHKDLSNKLEKEANQFASELLMPKRFFAPLCLAEEPSLLYITSLANKFMTSLTATALKYIEFCNEPVAIIFSQHNKIQWFQGSADFDRLRDDLNFFIKWEGFLDPDTLTGKLSKDSNYPKKKTRTPASSWFTHGKYNKDATIQEHSIAMPNHRAVLTLIWIDEELDEGYYDIW
jgi:Zn-dependent peptidase ImmA (M78 family)